jgi:hypothetical protein
VQAQSLKIHTCVPELRLVKSNVVPEGTARAERMMVEQLVFDLLAADAPLDPVNVQVVARLARSGAAVGSGAGAGAAITKAVAVSARIEDK